MNECILLNTGIIVQLMSTHTISQSIKHVAHSGPFQNLSFKGGDVNISTTVHQVFGLFLAVAFIFYSEIS